MKKLGLFLCLYFVMFCLVQSRVFACEPQMEPSIVQDTIDKSSIVIIGKRAQWQRYIKNYHKHNVDPPRKIEVIEVLQGTLEKDMIKVQGSWGMCGIAFNFEDKGEYIMMLNKGSDGIYYPAGDYNDIYAIELDSDRKLSLNKDGTASFENKMSVEEFKQSFLSPIGE